MSESAEPPRRSATEPTDGDLKNVQGGRRAGAKEEPEATAVGYTLKATDTLSGFA